VHYIQGFAAMFSPVHVAACRIVAVVRGMALGADCMPACSLVCCGCVLHTENLTLMMMMMM